MVWVCGLGEALMTLNEPVKANQLDKQVKSVWQVRVADSV